MIHGKTECPVCKRQTAIRPNGRLFRHQRFSVLQMKRVICPASGRVLELAP